MQESWVLQIREKVNYYKFEVNLPYHLNVNFKASIADAVNKASSPMAAVMILTPSDET